MLGVHDRAAPAARPASEYRRRRHTPRRPFECPVNAVFTGAALRCGNAAPCSPATPAAAQAETLVTPLTMIVTADGEWVLPDSEAFLAALGDPEPDFDGVGFAVRNLGHIKFLFLDRLVTEIDLHPRNVGPAALQAAQAQVRRSPAKLFRIKYLQGDWKSEIS